MMRGHTPLEYSSRELITQSNHEKNSRQTHLLTKSLTSNAEDHQGHKKQEKTGKLS